MESQNACMNAHTIRVAISVNKDLASLSKSAYRMDGVINALVSPFCRKGARHRGSPSPIWIAALLFCFYPTLFATDWGIPSAIVIGRLAFLAEWEDAGAFFALNVHCHLQQLPLFIFKRSGLYEYKMMGNSPTTQRSPPSNATRSWVTPPTRVSLASRP